MQYTVEHKIKNIFWLIKKKKIPPADLSKTSWITHQFCRFPPCALLDRIVRKFKKIEENILNLSFEVDTIEEKEGGDDIESSDSDNDDGDVGEFDPELEAKTKTLADQTQRQWHAGPGARVPGA